MRSLLACIAVLATLGCEDPQRVATPASRQVDQAPPSDVAPPPRHLGVLTSRSPSTVASSVAGQVGDILVGPGDSVSVGQEVVLLDARQLDAELGRARAALAAAEATESQMSIDAADRRSQLNAAERGLRFGVASRAEVQSARFAAGKASAAVRRAKADSLRAREELRQLEEGARITAQTTGVVGEILVRPGDSVRAGTPLLRILDPHDLLLRFAVPTQVANELARGTVVMWHPDGGGAPIEATITRVSPELEAAAQLSIAEANIVDEKASALPLGVRGRVDLQLVQ